MLGCKLIRRYSRSLAAIATLWLCGFAAQAQDSGVAMSRSVFGTNTYLSEGATALMLGNYERGVELTRLALNDLLSSEERAATLSNLCAGYIGLKEYDVAIVYCNRSLDINPDNWRALQNRAAAYTSIGNYKRALSDIEKGLSINPDSEALKLTLAIMREQERRHAKPRAARS